MIAVFAIEAHDLLVARMRDDADFLRGKKTALLKYARGRDAGAAQVLHEHGAAAVFAHDAENGDATAEAMDIVHHVRGAAKPKAFIRHPEHRDGRLGRDAVDLAPDKAIEHQIADDENAASTELSYQRKQPRIFTRQLLLLQ